MSTDLDRKDLRPCALCGKGLLNGGAPIFYRVTIESFGVVAASIREHAGLETMLGSPALAAMFASRPTIAKTIGEPTVGLVCLPCASDRTADIELACIRALRPLLNKASKPMPEVENEVGAGVSSCT